jgi:hypothetical protein
VTLSAHLAHVPRGKPIEIWFQDEARIGQKNGLVRQWARRGSRPRQPADQRYESAYLFGAICPARGTGAALAMPYADSEAMQLHLEEVSRVVRRGAHAVLLLDRAGWHTSRRLAVPKNITLVFLPSRAPELNPVENILKYLRQNWLSNRVFETYDAIVDAACEAWHNLPRSATATGSRRSEMKAVALPQRGLDRAERGSSGLELAGLDNGTLLVRLGHQAAILAEPEAKGHGPAKVWASRPLVALHGGDPLPDPVALGLRHGREDGEDQLRDAVAG